MSQEPTEEQLREALKQLRVQDVLLQTLVTLINLAGRRLTSEEEKDLDQAKLGIEAVRALLPLCPQEEVAPVRDALSQLQMIYVRERQGAPEPAEEPQARPGKSEEDQERAKARSKIWTPPGT